MAYLLNNTSRSVRLATCYRSYGKRYSPFVLSEEVRHAKAENNPIVALESTIISHGMPYPQNLETAMEVEDIIRKRGATPATVAILNGQLRVGLQEDQLRYLAQAQDVTKASRRDLAAVAAAKLDGATTVAGTLVATELADIPVFVTGGIGGVHREGEDTLDISADLTELGRSRTLVVCSGVKSILDIGRTLEYLETLGVCVCSFGESEEFPAFYAARSGHRAAHRVADARRAARVLLAARAMQLSSGILVAVPVPQEYAMDEKIIENLIVRALEDAKNKGVRGKEVTPFILSAVASATGGASLEANIALIKNNAKVGADIAVELKKLKNVDDLENNSNIGFAKGGGKYSSNISREFHTSCNSRSEAGCENEDDLPLLKSDKHAEGDVLVIGGANVDRTYRITEDKLQLDGSTHPCATEQCGGGVGRNMAEALWRLRQGRTRLLTAVGDDADGRYLADIAPGLLLDGCIMKSGRTPTYAAVLDARGECQLGLGDMALHNNITVDLVDKHIKVLEQAPIVVIDGNVRQATINHVLELCHRLQKPVFFEPTDRRKATKALVSKHSITYSSPNLSELRAMASFLQPDVHIEATSDMTEILKLSKIASKFINFLIITMGSKGVAVINNLHGKILKAGEVEARFYPAEVLEYVQNVSGAGDCFSSGFIYGIIAGFKESKCARVGFKSAKAALLSRHTVPSDLSIANLNLNEGRMTQPYIIKN